MRTTVFAVLLLMLAPGLARAEILFGTVTYLQRMMLPPAAVVEISLQDVSLADAPARILASYRIPDPGAPPYRFAFAYDPARIDPTRSYTVAARVTVGDSLRFITDTAYPVLTRGGGTEVEMVMTMVSEAPPPKPDADTVNTYWKILTLGGAPAEVPEGTREPHLILRTDGSYAATIGCNMMRGPFDLDGDTITFHPGPATLMACPSPLDTLERGLGAMLKSAARIAVTGEEMELLDAAGGVLARFQAVYF